MIKLTSVLEPSVQSIKAIRAVTGYGLKESKDIHDLILREGEAEIALVHGDEVSAVKKFRREGFQAELVSPFQSYIHIPGLDVIYVDQTVGVISSYETVDEEGFIHLTARGNPLMLSVRHIIAYGRVV